MGKRKEIQSPISWQLNTGRTIRGKKKNECAKKKTEKEPKKKIQGTIGFSPSGLVGKGRPMIAQLGGEDDWGAREQVLARGGVPWFLLRKQK